MASSGAGVLLVLVGGEEGKGVPFGAVNAMVAEHAADVPHAQIRVVSAAAAPAAAGVPAGAKAAAGQYARILVLFGGAATAAALAALPTVAGMDTRIVVRECADAAPRQGQEQQRRLEALKHAALVSGLELLSASLLPSSAPELTARRAQFELGAAARLPLRRKGGGGAAAFAKAAGAPAAGPEDALIDDDELLTEEDMRRPAPRAAGSECAPKRKACKNCTCGRAEEEQEQEEQEATRRRARAPGAGGAAGGAAQAPSPVQLSNPYLTEEQINNPKSACGSVRRSGPPAPHPLPARPRAGAQA